MPTLTTLDAEHGYIAGANSIDTSGYVAVIPAFQKVYFADGRNYDDKGYWKLDFVNTKIVGVATTGILDYGEPVLQDSSGATGNYMGCEDVKLTGTLGDADVPFQLGEKVTQAASLAIGYVVYVGSGFINVCPVSRNGSTGALVNFSAATDTVTGATSAATIATVSAVSTIGYGKFHFIYRTSTTEFDQNNDIDGLNNPTYKIVPTTAADGTPDEGAAIQHIYTDGTASAGTFTITYDGQTTAAIAYNASWATIKTALETLSTVAADDIVVTGESGTDFTDVSATDAMIFTFKSTLGSVNAVSVTESLTGVTAVTVKPMVTGFTTITAPPHWLTWKPVATYSATTNPGIMPDGGSNIGCLCFGRGFLNSMKNPHQWFCTRSFDLLDLDSSQTDVGAATYGQTSKKAGVVADPIIAMIPYKDRYLIFGCANEMHLLTGDPLMGGTQRCLSKTTGIFSPTSYCWDDKNNFYWLGIDGIYKLTTDALLSGASPENITKQHIPKLISALGLNRRTDRVAMAYDKQRYGIEVSVTQQDGAWAVCFWIDLRTGGLFPDVFPTDQSPASMYYFDAYKSSERKLLKGDYDGYIGCFDESEKSDRGSNAIEAHVCVGPFVADGEPRNTVDISEISLTTGEETDGVTVDVHRAKSADEVVANVLDAETPTVTKTLTGDGLQDSIVDKVSGRAVVIKVENTTADESFSMEEINLAMKVAGREK